MCYLIKSVEEARGGFVSDIDVSQVSYDDSESSAQHVISKKLVTFSCIQDLQQNNQKLLALVRQLSEKQEAAEKISASEFNDLKVIKENESKFIKPKKKKKNLFSIYLIFLGERRKIATQS